MHKKANGVLTPCQHTPNQNHLLASLSPEVYGRLLPHLRMIQVRKNEILSDHKKRPGVVYFPVDCIISLYHPLKDGELTEIAMIGNEGMFDITHFMGGEGLPYLVMAGTTGHAFLLDEGLLKHEFDHENTVCHVLMLYAQALITQMAQTIVCNKGHSLNQQLSLLLLLVNDKVLSDDLLLTHENIAHMMGVRREGITEAAGRLRDLGLIDYRRGHITVLDRPGLEEQCCECYAMVTNEFSRLFGGQDCANGRCR